MSMIVKTNMDAIRTVNLLDQNNNMLQKHLSKVATGMKINSAQDDASGYAISERMRVRIRSLDQANQNTQNDSSLMKTAEGAVANTVEILRALKEKAINAANDTNTDEDRATIQKEIDQFIDQVDDNALVQFNGKYLVDGSKNNVYATSKTVLLNQSLATATTSDSALTALKNRVGDALEIQSTDYYTVSWVANGETHTTSSQVSSASLSNLLELSHGSIVPGSSSVPLGQDKFKVDVYTPDKTEGIALVAATPGVSTQISGFTISITDAQGNVKKAANAALDQFKQYQRAENQTGDKALTFHVGSEANVAIKVGIGDMRAEALGLTDSEGNVTIDVSNDSAIQSSLATVSSALEVSNSVNNNLQSTLNDSGILDYSLDQATDQGAYLARLDYQADMYTTMEESAQEAENTIGGADMAKQASQLRLQKIQQQVAVEVSKIFNHSQAGVLRLLQ